MARELCLEVRRGTKGSAVPGRNHDDGHVTQHAARARVYTRVYASPSVFLRRPWADAPQSIKRGELWMERGETGFPAAGLLRAFTT